MMKTTVVKRIAAIVILSVLAAPLFGCKDSGAEKKEKADAELKQWIEKGAEFQHSEPKKSAF